MEDYRYPQNIDEQNTDMVCEPAVALSNQNEQVVMPADLPYAYITNGVLQITPDLEEEIAEAEQGDVVTMDEFKTMFAKWLD